MKQYIGTKLVEAEPARRINGKAIVGMSEVVAIDSTIEQGYRVRYPDGYESWSPKEVFEAAYLPLHVNPKMPTDKPSVSQEMVDAFIAATEVATMGDKTTVCRAMLRNGFEIVESSSCVSKENYSEAVGVKNCMERIKSRVWMLLGFLLQTAVAGVKAADVNTMVQQLSGQTEGGARKGLSFGAAIEAVKGGKRIARKGWNGKGQFVELASNVAYLTPGGEAVNADHEAIGNKALAFHGTSGVQLGWLASQADMLAEDWEIVE